MAPNLGFQYNKESVDYLIEKHYRPTNRPMRACHPRDLLLQVRNYCFVCINRLSKWQLVKQGTPFPKWSLQFSLLFDNVLTSLAKVLWKRYSTTR